MIKALTGKESLLTGAVSNYAAMATHILIGVCLTPFIISHVGKTGYGIWTLLSTFIGYYGLLDLGITSAVQRYVALYKGQSDEQALNETISTALATFFCTGMLIVAASFLLARPCVDFFQVSAGEARDFTRVFRLIGIAIAISFPANVFAAVMSGNGKFFALNAINASSIMLRAVWIVVALLAGAGIVGIAVGNVISQIFKLAANYAAAKKVMPSGRFSWRQARGRTFRKIVYFGGVATIIMIANQMRTALDRVIVGKWVGLQEVALYGLAAQMAEYAMTAIIQGMNVLTPRFANLQGTNDSREITRLFKTSLHVSAFMSFGFYTGALLFGEQLILLWVGPGFVEAKWVLWILMTGFVFDLAQHPGIGLMFALNKHHLYAKMIVAEAVAKIALSLLLVSRYGLVGVAIGTALPMVIMRSLVQPVYVSRLAGVGLADYVRPLLKQMGVSCLIVSAPAFFKLLDLQPVTLVQVLTSILIVAASYSALSIALLDKNQKKDMYLQAVKVMSRRKVEPNV